MDEGMRRYLAGIRRAVAGGRGRGVGSGVPGFSDPLGTPSVSADTVDVAIGVAVVALSAIGLLSVGVLVGRAVVGRS